jgi:signal transduction histidine kinase
MAVGSLTLIGLVISVLAVLLLSVSLRRARQQWLSERDRRLNAENDQKRMRELESLARALSRAQTREDATLAFLSEVLPAIGADAGLLAFLNPDGSSLEIVQVMGYADEAAAKQHRVPLESKTLLADVAQHLRPLICTSRARWRVDMPDLAIDPVLVGEGAIVMPLVLHGRPQGVVALTFQHAYQPAGDDDAGFLVCAIEGTVQAIDRAGRLERAERARAELEAYRTRANKELRERQRAEEALRESEARYRALAARTNRLYTLSAGLSEAITLHAVAKTIVREGQVVAGASAGSVAVLVEDGAQFETLYSERHPPQLIDGWHRFAAEEGLCSTAAVQERRAVLISSFAEWQQQYPRSASMAADGGYASVAVLPLLVENAPIGVLSFYFTAPLHFDAEYLALLTSIAHHAAQAIDRARSYDAAQQARAEAEAANRSKDEFLSIISHELRTPLTAVLGWAAMLRGRTLDVTRAPRAVEAIYTNATRQARLIDELLDISRIMAGRAPLDLQDVDLAENVRAAVEGVLPLAEEKEVDVQLAALPRDVRLPADPHRLQQVFANLLGNAVKFTPAGGRVSIEVAVSERSIDLRIADTGRGIDRAFLPFVFDRFRQADSTAARSAGGLGLGLFIARRLVEAHGGHISAESEGEGRGSAFTVSFPCERTASSTVVSTPGASHAAEQDSPHEWPSLQGIRILLVDDVADTREMMASVLESCGAGVLMAASGDEAIDVLGREDGHLDVLLSDIAMPGTDGYEFIRRVRARPLASIASIPAAAITACAGQHERERALAAGFQEYLVKPLSPEALARAVAGLVHVAPASPTVT